MAVEPKVGAPGTRRVVIREDETHTPIRRSWSRRPPVGEQPWPERRRRPPTPREVTSWLQRWMPDWFQLLPWHRELIRALYGQPRPFQAIASIPRGNGKTTIAAALSCFELWGRGERGAQVLHLATSQRQARLCYDTAVAMAEERPELASRAAAHWIGGYERTTVRELGAFMSAMPARGSMRSLQGYTPSLAVVDEVGFIEEEAWVSMAQAVVKRPSALVLGIGTPGYDQSGLMYRMRTLARERPTADFAFCEWSAPDSCEVDDVRAWRKANPAMASGIKNERAMRALLQTSTEHDFRTFQLGQWVGRPSTWLPLGQWASLGRIEAPPEGSEVWLGFDGSATGDATALCWAAEGAVGCVELWERPAAPDWKVPRSEVMDTVRWAFSHWDVRALYADPWGWRSELEQLEREFGDERVVLWPTSSGARFGPAVDRFQVAATTGRLVHDHHPGLARHVQNATVHRTPSGQLLDKPEESKKIDGAIAAILAYHGAETQPAAPVYSERLVY